MNIYSMIKKLVFTVLFVFLSGTLAAGEDFSFEKLYQDFSEKKVRLIRGPGERLLINKGARDGIRKGDLFTVYLPGRAVIDPATGENLGNLDEPAAVCQAIKCHEAFAEVSIQCPGEDCSVQAGLEAVRFRDIKAFYRDATGSAFSEYKRLRAELGHMDWQGYKQGAESRPDKAIEADPAVPVVVFVAGKKRLTVWAGSEILALYPLVDRGGGDPAEADQAVLSRAKTVAGKSRPHAPGAAERGSDTALPGMAEKIKARDIQVFSSLERVVHNFGVTVPRGGKEPFLVTLSGVQICAKALNGNQSHQYQYTGFGDVVNMSVADDGRLALNIYAPGEGMRSKILALSTDGFRPVAEDINYILAFMPDPERKPGVQLWAQRFSPADLLLPVVYRLELKDNRISGKSQVPVPHGFNLFSAFYADLDGNGIRECGFFNPGGRLVVYEFLEKKWQSTTSYAGSLKTLLIDDPENKDAAPQRLKIWARPVFFEHRGNPLIACALNQAGLAGMLGQPPGRGALGILDSPAAGFRFRHLDNQFSGPVQDIFVWQDQLLVCIVEGGLFNTNGPSHILALPLAPLFLSAGSP